MKEETAKQIIDDIKQIGEYTLERKYEMHDVYTPEEIGEALEAYARMKDIDIELLDDRFIGSCILSYEIRKEEEIDYDGLIEEMAMVHLISMSLDVDLYEYNRRKMLEVIGAI